jgi:hypothetical protein
MQSTFLPTESGAGHRRTDNAVSRKTKSQSGGLLQEFPVPGGELEDSTAGRGESRDSLRGVVSPAGIIVTNLETNSRAGVQFYNKRGTAEQRIKEGKQPAKMARLSCHRFRSNEVPFWPTPIAYNLEICGGGSRCRRRSTTGH